MVAQAAGFAVDNKLPTLTVDQEIERRVEFLTAYQNAAYAAKYRKLVDEVRAAETKVMPGQNRLTRAVAQGYFRLMAYKDEYEVARLHTDDSFMKKLKTTFEDGFTLHFHMAPPIIAGKDPVTGHREKRQFGPWMMFGFRILKKFKFLRGTSLDLFGLQADRKMERALIGEYETIFHEVAANLTPGNYDVAAQLAVLPQKMRGYGHVKEKNVAETKLIQQQMLAEFREKPETAKAQTRTPVPAE
jgi:indolepyruvate ferredoxin oxidoreductase